MKRIVELYINGRETPITFNDHEDDEKKIIDNLSKLMDIRSVTYIISGGNIIMVKPSSLIAVKITSAENDVIAVDIDKSKKVDTSSVEVVDTIIG